MLPAEIRLLHIMGIIYEGYRYPTFWTERVDEEGYFLPILLPSRLWTQGRLVLLLNWYLHFLDQSHASGLSTRICCRICGMLTDGNWRIHTPSRLSRSCLLAVAAAAHLGGIVDRRPG